MIINAYHPGRRMLGLPHIQDASSSHFEECEVSEEACALQLQLQAEIGLPSRVARVCVENGSGALLLAYKHAGGVATREQPLILLAVDLENASSRNFFHGGNYELDASCAGQLDRPTKSSFTGEYPAWVTPGPHAMGKFLCCNGLARDVSNGQYLLISFAHRNALEEARAAIQNMAQFQRIGPSAARAMQVPVQDPLVSIFTLDFTRPPSRQAIAFPHFHQTE